MATLTLRNVPDDLYAALKESAKRNRRSLNQEAIAELAARRQSASHGRDMAWERAGAGREELESTGVWATAEDIDRFINEGRDRRDLMLAAAAQGLRGRDVAGERVRANREKRGITVDHREIDEMIEHGRR